ncbi:MULTISPECIES: hypothetical protein [unclassified Brachybacterium]|uniref:hypothetical protein n=1 Tax=unclassified Brachybacterium TaxID=2623841 RepID=UPI000C80A95B|nr:MULTISPECIES: hypothetical protein [unclassified Brachybacterium]PMC74448.1 hypothetical protein CJ197_13480 [Brachybacterium sp. UMB0905]
MSIEHTTAPEEREAREDNVTSRGNSTVLSVILFVVLFGLFAGGLYVMSLISMDEPSVGLFLGGLTMSLVALYATFDLVPRVLNR